METQFNSTTTARELLIKRIIDGLLEAAWYGEWLGDSDKQRRDNHAGVLKLLDRITDVMLFRLYEELYVYANEIIPCLADKDGKYLNIWIKGYYGGMIEDGSIHT